MEKSVTSVVVSAESDRQMLEKHGQDILIVLHAARKDELEKKIETAGEAYKKSQEKVEQARQGVVEACAKQAEKHYAKTVKKIKDGLDELPGCSTVIRAFGELVKEGKGIRLVLMLGNDGYTVTVSDVGADADEGVKKSIKAHEDALKVQAESTEMYVKLQKELQRLPREREQTEAKLALERLKGSEEASALLKKMDGRKLLS